MKLPNALVLIVIAACSGQSPPVTNGTGTGSTTAPPAAACEGIKAKVEQLYRAEAEAKEPKHVDGAVADNTQMVMNDCAKDPGKVSACVQAASSVAELETKCLRQLDDEGTEGNDLK